MEKQCSKCGAVYKITSEDYPMRDRDSLKCEFCGETYFSWNCGKIYSRELISGPTKDEYKIGNQKSNALK
ncbi:hypothetical protein AGMMS49944_08370 [Spirochaetia bacterium]|nr:hypothetical protein AGMMS49944_08370 [Spirochaetia bacterium]